MQAVKRDLSQDMTVVHRELEEVGERVATLEEHENARDEEIEQLQQEIICLKDKQIKIQVHTEDRENRSRQNNIPIWGAPTVTEEEDILAYVRTYARIDLFVGTKEIQQTLGDIDIGPCALSEHATVSITLNVPLRAEGPRPWRMRTRLLIRPEVVAQITKAIAICLEFNDPADTPISLSWDTLKAVIRRELKVIAVSDNKIRHEKRAQLQVAELERIHERMWAREFGDNSVHPISGARPG
ncbi:hypothetical protein NDU88_008418 [Pleurodeles waltl]|uniref:Uncharacterized protein n=1 Tax=Pleurodeles waltl TaxID=8319 RepID=A0AAV7PP39_PLEWA|nr:hypothetical protein NDU88_008418 [Pleurodeles waltl]